MFENRVLRKVFGPKRDDVTEEWRKILIELFNDLFVFVCLGFVGKTRAKRLLGGPRRRWEYNIKMDIQEVVVEYMDWIDLVWDEDRWVTWECGN